MTYFADLSQYEYLRSGPVAPSTQLLNVGWLDNDHEFPAGDAGPHFLMCLVQHLARPANQTRGYHLCELCHATETNKITTSSGEVTLGSAELHVFSGPIGYAAPNLVVHYVDQHRYLPPSEFIDAVLGSCGATG
jgi:hypothetical protein